MKRLLAFVLAGAAVSVSAPAAADFPAMGGPSLMQSRDQRSGTKAYGLESNAAVLMLNFSLSLRHWESEVTGWNGRRLNNEVSMYMGVGLLNVIEIQRGFSNAGPRTRIRIDISLSENFPFPSDEKWGRFQRGIVLTPFVESAFGRKVYGLGLGLAFQ